MNESLNCIFRPEPEAGAEYLAPESSYSFVFGIGWLGLFTYRGTSIYCS